MADRLRRVAALVERRPLLTVAVIAVVVAAGHAIWIWTHRRLGALDPDEAGYIATAFRYQRTFDLFSPYQFVRAVGGTGFGPMVPLLSLPLLWIGPDDPRTVMMIQPILMVVGAVVVAGITRRVAGSWAAVVVGVAFVVAPTVVTATQTYWFGLGGAVGLGVAVWGLVESDRCRTRATWWFGVGVATMLLARTMTLGYVPAAIGTALVITRWNRESLRRLAESALIALVIAAPWWIVEWPTISGYLFDYGFGPTAAVYGSGGPWARLAFRLDRIGEAVGPNVAATVVAVAVVVAVAAVAALVSARRSSDGPAPSWRPEMTDRWRSGLALATGSVLGVGSLISTTNAGVWFELPLLMFLLPLAGLIVSVPIEPRPLAWAVRAAVVLPIVGMGLVQTPVSWWLLPPTTSGVPWLARNHLTSSQQEPGFAEYDGRFATANRGQEIGAAEEWWELTRTVRGITAAIEDETDGPVSFWFSGSMEMLNTNTLFLDAELEGDDSAFHIPDTTGSPSERAADLSPRAPVDRDGRHPERVLVVALHSNILFPPDRDVAGFTRQAMRAGWEVTDRVPMPGGGEVRVLRHPDRAGGAAPPDR